MKKKGKAWAEHVFLPQNMVWGKLVGEGKAARDVDCDAPVTSPPCHCTQAEAADANGQPS